jgi:hypothetical protein
LKLSSLVTRLFDELYAKEGRVENPRLISYIDGIERLRGMVNEARWNDIEAPTIPDLLNQSSSWVVSPPDVNMEIDSELPWSPVTAR